jgi:hydrogenase maturation protein HypF
MFGEGREHRRERLRLEVRGSVQGVGFRPFVYRLAVELGLVGSVSNSPCGATIEIEGEREHLDDFHKRLRVEKPPVCDITQIVATPLPPLGNARFLICSSRQEGSKTAVILPDLATCADCLREIFDPKDRRYRYPFTNCTNCGPRYSILESLPYDRARTTMKGFSLCNDCRIEYDDPGDRRFHAQPNACPRCGPKLQWWDEEGIVRAEGEGSIIAAATAVRAGRIVAAKGLGGFHLLADARNQEAVMRLRCRKRREAKPFGLMAPDLATIQRCCVVSAAEENLLRSPAAPLVLLRRRPDAPVAPSVAPGNPYLAFMLPYTPLHHLLLAELGLPIVATSGNCSDEPICIDENEARTRLAGIADGFLVHNRPIVRPVDDSVARIVLGQEMVLRRARGCAPFPITVAEPLPALLALGAHQKNTIAVAAENQIIVGQHLGDLDTLLARNLFHRTIDDLTGMYELTLRAVVCDAHPDYYSTRYAEKMNLPVVRVQHHHAHVRACMVEHGLTGSVLGVAWDGTGYGGDGSVWGGELLRVGANDTERVGHLRSFYLPGGECAIREPRRTAVGLLYEILGEALFARRELAPLDDFSASELEVLRGMLRASVNSPRTTSAGRLFDAVASLLDLRHRVDFEGQAAMELEFAVIEDEEATIYPFNLDASGVLDWEPMIRTILDDIVRGVPAGVVACRFHATMAEFIVAEARRSGESVIVLTGGCFQNACLLTKTVERLRAAEYNVYWPQRIPPNDGGISLGQIAAAAANIRRRE